MDAHRFSSFSRWLWVIRLLVVAGVAVLVFADSEVALAIGQVVAAGAALSSLFALVFRCPVRGGAMYGRGEPLLLGARCMQCGRRPIDEGATTEA